MRDSPLLPRICKAKALQTSENSFPAPGSTLKSGETGPLMEGHAPVLEGLGCPSLVRPSSSQVTYHPIRTGAACARSQGASPFSVLGRWFRKWALQVTNRDSCNSHQICYWLCTPHFQSHLAGDRFACSRLCNSVTPTFAHPKRRGLDGCPRKGVWRNCPGTNHHHH